MLDLTYILAWLRLFWLHKSRRIKYKETSQHKQIILTDQNELANLINHEEGFLILKILLILQTKHKDTCVLGFSLGVDPAYKVGQPARHTINHLSKRRSGYTTDWLGILVDPTLIFLIFF
jgi:hypothetical protein